MPRRAAVAAALDTWREAERVLTLLPPASPERSQIEGIVSFSRATYQALAAASDQSSDAIAQAVEAMSGARLLLRRVAESHESGGPQSAEG